MTRSTATSWVARRNGHGDHKLDPLLMAVSVGQRVGGGREGRLGRVTGSGETRINGYRSKTRCSVHCSCDNRPLSVWELTRSCTPRQEWTEQLCDRCCAWRGAGGGVGGRWRWTLRIVPPENQSPSRRRVVDTRLDDTVGEAASAFSCRCCSG